MKFQPTRLPYFVHRCLRETSRVLDAAGVNAQPVVVAVSGGGDSMALLEIVALLAPRLGLDVHVACIDHNQRPEAAAEVELVRAAARRLGATFHPRRVDPGGSDEDSLRRARHAALEEIRLAAGARFILLGHTSDDQIETMVFRFLRGAGPGGLSGMRQARPPLLRPLLGVPRAELRRVLEARGVAWAEDPGNESDRYARGRLRSRLLPAIEAAFGQGALRHLLDLAPRWRDDEDFLEMETTRLLAYAVRGGRGQEVGQSIEKQSGRWIDAGALLEAHPALRSRAIRRWMSESSGQMVGSREVAAVERWLASSGGSGSLDVAGATLVGVEGRVTLEKAVLPPSQARVRFPRN
ncbi:MAG: tRNA lysidine(34) synthetase TilS [Candidatus Binatia bacterium]